MKAKEFIPASKPRNPVVRQQQTSGAGAHRDKKKEQKQGYEKHKGKSVSETELRDKGDLQAKRKALQDLQMDPIAAQDKQIKQAIMQRKADLEKEAKSKGMSERIRDPEDWDEGNTEPPNNMAVYINGKLWKVFRGNGYYADDEREMNQYYKLQDWARKKSQATGKKWEVSRTGAPATESIAKEDGKEIARTHKGGIVTKTAQGIKHTKTDYDDEGLGWAGKDKPDSDKSPYKKVPILDKDDD